MSSRLRAILAAALSGSAIVLAVSAIAPEAAQAVSSRPVFSEAFTGPTQVADCNAVGQSDLELLAFPGQQRGCGEISDEAGYCAEFHDGYVVSAVCSCFPAQIWAVVPSACYSGGYRAYDEWVTEYNRPYVYMNHSDDGAGNLISLADPCGEAASWYPVPG